MNRDVRDGTIKLGAQTPRVSRLGLASRGNTNLKPDDVHHAIESGVGYLNWCAHSDGLSQAVAELDTADRARVVVAAQFYARSAEDARRELEAHLVTLDTEYIDVLTFYYVEQEAKWHEIGSGALPVLQRAKERGQVRLIGLTTHQRPLARQLARTGEIDLLMIRYNAAHRGAEREIFPITDDADIPVVAFTCLRWGALLRSTPDDPEGFEPPTAPELYRYVLAHPSVSVALTAPNDRRELESNLSVLRETAPLSDERMLEIKHHGDRVHRHGGGFP